MKKINVKETFKNVKEAMKPSSIKESFIDSANVFEYNTREAADRIRKIFS